MQNKKQEPGVNSLPAASGVNSSSIDSLPDISDIKLLSEISKMQKSFLKVVKFGQDKIHKNLNQNLRSLSENEIEMKKTGAHIAKLKECGWKYAQDQDLGFTANEPDESLVQSGYNQGKNYFTDILESIGEEPSNDLNECFLKAEKAFPELLKKFENLQITRDELKRAFEANSKSSANSLKHFEIVRTDFNRNQNKLKEAQNHLATILNNLLEGALKDDTKEIEDFLGNFNARGQPSQLSPQIRIEESANIGAEGGAALRNKRKRSSSEESGKQL